LSYGFYGNLSSWAEAETYCYSDPIRFLEKVKTAILKVKAGEAACERDSVLFDRIEHSYPLLAYLLYIAGAHDNKLNLLDFGGSLGSSYFQCRGFLEHLRELKWSVVEQAHYVACGQEAVEDDVLKFYYTIEESVIARHPESILLSGVVQSFEEPYAFLEQLVGHDFEYIVFDRTPFIPAPDRLTVFVVPPEIDDAVYPIWFFNLELFLSVFAEKYELLDDFETAEGEGYPLEDGIIPQYKGFLFRRKQPAAECSD